MVKDKRKHGKKKCKRKASILTAYLSEELMNRRYKYNELIDSYLIGQFEKYEKDYPDLKDKGILLPPLLRVSSKILNIIYFNEIADLITDFPKSQQTVTTQKRHIDLLKKLKDLSWEQVEKTVKEISSSKLIESSFKLVFQFLKAGVIYYEEKKVPERVSEALPSELGNAKLNLNETQMYMTYISDVTQRCLTDLTEDASDYLALFITTKQNSEITSVREHSLLSPKRHTTKAKTVQFNDFQNSGSNDSDNNKENRLNFGGK